MVHWFVQDSAAVTQGSGAGNVFGCPVADEEAEPPSVWRGVFLYCGTSPDNRRDFR
jgi:hypothetical protein